MVFWFKIKRRLEADNLLESSDAVMTEKSSRSQDYLREILAEITQCTLLKDDSTTSRRGLGPQASSERCVLWYNAGI